MFVRGCVRVLCGYVNEYICFGFFIWKIESPIELNFKRNLNWIRMDRCKPKFLKVIEQK